MDFDERRRAQNRLAQRKYRKKLQSTHLNTTNRTSISKSSSTQTQSSLAVLGAERSPTTPHYESPPSNGARTSWELPNFGAVNYSSQSQRSTWNQNHGHSNSGSLKSNTDFSVFFSQEAHQTQLPRQQHALPDTPTSYLSYSPTHSLQSGGSRPHSVSLYSTPEQLGDPTSLFDAGARGTGYWPADIHGHGRQDSLEFTSERSGSTGQQHQRPHSYDFGVVDLAGAEGFGLQLAGDGALPPDNGPEDSVRNPDPRRPPEVPDPENASHLSSSSLICPQNGNLDEPTAEVNAAQEQPSDSSYQRDETFFKQRRHIRNKADKLVANLIELYDLGVCLELCQRDSEFKRSLQMAKRKFKELLSLEAGEESDGND